MQKLNRTRRIRESNACWPSGEVSGYSIYPEHYPEDAPEMRMGRQQRNPRPGGPAPRSRRPMPGARAAALFEQNEAGWLRALANLSPSFHSNSPCLSQRPVAGAHGRPAGYGKNQEAGEDGNWAVSARPKAFPKMPARASAPDRRPIRSLRSLITRSAVRRAARWTKHRIGRARRRSLRCRSLGLATASLRLWGACANFRWNARKFLPHSLQAGMRLQRRECSGQTAVRWESLTKRRLALLRLLGQPAHTFFRWRTRKSCLPAKRAWAASARPQSLRVLFRFCCVLAVSDPRHCPTNPGSLLTTNSTNLRSSSAMPLLTVEPKTKPHTMKLTLDGNTYNRLMRYCGFTNNGSESSVIREALKYVFDKDEEFVAWEKKPENQDIGNRPTPPKKKATPQTPGGPSSSLPDPTTTGKSK